MFALQRDRSVHVDAGPFIVSLLGTKNFPD